MNKKFIDLLEHTFWTDPTEQAEFLKDKHNLGNAFWVNFLGFAALYQANKDYGLLKQYFKADQVRLPAIKDTNQDLTFVIKACVDQKMLQTGVANELTRFLALLKQGQIPSVDEVILRTMLFKVKLTKVPPTPILKKVINDFLNGKSTLQQTVPPMFAFSKRMKINHEFVGLARKMMPHVDTDPTPDDNDAAKTPDAVKDKNTIVTLPDKSQVDKTPAAVVAKQTIKTKAFAQMTGIEISKVIEKTKTNDALGKLGVTKIENIDDMICAILEVWQYSATKVVAELKKKNWDDFGGFKTAWKNNIPDVAARMIIGMNQSIQTAPSGREVGHAVINMTPLNKELNKYFNDATLIGIGHALRYEAKFANAFALTFIFSPTFDPTKVLHLQQAIMCAYSRYNESDWTQIRGKGYSVVPPNDRDRFKTPLGDGAIIWKKIEAAAISKPDPFMKALDGVELKHGSWILNKRVDKYYRKDYDDWREYLIMMLFGNISYADSLPSLFKAIFNVNINLASKLYTKNSMLNQSTDVKQFLTSKGKLGQSGFTANVSVNDIPVADALKSEKFLELIKRYLNAGGRDISSGHSELYELLQGMKKSLGQVISENDLWGDIFKYLRTTSSLGSLSGIYGEKSILYKMPEFSEEILDYLILKADEVWTPRQAPGSNIDLPLGNIDGLHLAYQEIMKLANRNPKIKILNNKVIKPNLYQWISKAADYYNETISNSAHSLFLEMFGIETISDVMNEAFEHIGEWGLDYSDMMNRNVWSSYIHPNTYLSIPFQGWWFNRVKPQYSLGFRWLEFKRHPAAKANTHWGFTEDRYISEIVDEINKKAKNNDYPIDFTWCVMNATIKQPAEIAAAFKEVRDALFESDSPEKAAQALYMTHMSTKGESVTDDNLKMLKEQKIRFVKIINNLLNDVHAISKTKNMYDIDVDSIITDEMKKGKLGALAEVTKVIGQNEDSFVGLFQDHEVFTPEESANIKSLIVGLSNATNLLQFLPMRSLKLDIEQNPTDYDGAASLNFLNKNFKLKGSYTWTGKSRSVIEQEVLSYAGDLMYNVFNDKKLRPDLNAIIASYEGAKKADAVYKRLKDKAFVSPLVESIMGSDTPIKPLINMEPKDLMTTLRWNNFNFSASTGQNFYKRKAETYTEYLERITESKDDLVFDPPKLKVVEIDEEHTTLEEKTAEYIKHYSPGFTHGNIGVKFIKSFDVNLDIEDYEAFKKIHENDPSKIIIPAFHGTGSVAASMILRFGFRIITQSGAGVQITGKMLGDGVYFSTIIDKAAQYLGDSGFTRRHGAKGYLFEMEAVTGREGSDYKSAGVGNLMTRSPEWCVFNPRAQLRITKAHFVEMVPRTYIIDMAKKHNKAFKENKHFGHMLKFKEFMVEQEPDDYAYKGMNTIEFMFMDGMIPESKTVVSEFDAWAEKFTSKNCWVEPSTIGPVVVIRTPLDLAGRIVVDDTDNFCYANPEGLRDQFFTLVKQATGKDMI